MHKNLIYIWCVICSLLLCSCQYNTQVTDYSSNTSTDKLLITESNYDSKFVLKDNATINSEKESQTTSTEYIQPITDSFVYPDITLTESSSPDEIMQAGKELGIYYSSTAKKYFGYGTDMIWKLDYESSEPYRSDIMGIYQTSSTYWTAKGLYTDRSNNIYSPMNYSEAKHFMMENIKLTEQGFEDLCHNSPSSYMEIDGMLGVCSGDGGQAGWSYSYIVDYEMKENAVIYNCNRIGVAEEWGYNEDLIQPFTFSIAYDNDAWKLDSCSYSEGLFDLSENQ